MTAPILFTGSVFWTNLGVLPWSPHNSWSWGSGVCLSLSWKISRSRSSSWAGEPRYDREFIGIPAGNSTYWPELESGWSQ